MNEQATPAQPVSLATLMTPSKTVSIDYPEIHELVKSQEVSSS